MTVHFRTSKETSFTYDPDAGLYSGFQYGEDWADGNDGTVQTFRNILVLYAETQTIDDTGRLAIDLVGEGEGYLIRDGKCVAITWSREEEDAPFIYHLPDGTEAALVPAEPMWPLPPPEALWIWPNFVITAYCPACLCIPCLAAGMQASWAFFCLCRLLYSAGIYGDKKEGEIGNARLIFGGRRIMM